MHFDSQPVENHQVVSQSCSFLKFAFTYLTFLLSSLTQIHYVTEDVKSLCLAGKHYLLLPHSSAKVYNQTGLIPQGFNDKDLRPNKSSRQENSLSIAWGIWLHSHF